MQLQHCQTGQIVHSIDDERLTQRGTRQNSKIRVSYIRHISHITYAFALEFSISSCLQASCTYGLRSAILNLRLCAIELPVLENMVFAFKMLILSCPQTKIQVLLVWHSPSWFPNDAHVAKRLWSYKFSSGNISKLLG